MRILRVVGVVAVLLTLAIWLGHRSGTHGAIQEEPERIGRVLAEFFREAPGASA